MNSGAALRFLVAARDDPKLAAWAAVLHEYKLPIDTDVAPGDHWESFEALFVHDAIEVGLFNDVTYKELVGYRPCPAALQETLENLRILPEGAQGDFMTRVNRDNALALRQQDELAIPDTQYDDLALPEPQYNDLALPDFGPSELAPPDYGQGHRFESNEAPRRALPQSPRSLLGSGNLELQPRPCDVCGSMLVRSVDVEDFADPSNPDAQFTSYIIHSEACPGCRAVSCERIMVPIG